MRLSELSPKWVRYIANNTWREDIGIVEAQGLRFLCPLCFAANGGARGTHSVLCWKPSIPADVSPGPGRWDFSPASTSFENLTLVAGSSSVHLQGGCGAHFHINNGEVTFCG